MAAKRNSISRSFLLEAGDCDVDERIGRSEREKLGKFNPMQMSSRFHQQRPIRLFGVVSDGLKIAGLWHVWSFNLLNRKAWMAL